MAEMRSKRQKACAKHPFDKKTKNFFRNIVIQFHPYCPYCGKRIYGKFHIGHIISAFHGGTNDWSNLVPMHPKCNEKNGTDDLTDKIKALPPQKRFTIINYRETRENA